MCIRDRGICNGFQALIKLGLLPYGKITNIIETDPTLTFNTLGRHVSRMVYTRITSVKSPWFANVREGDVFAVPVSHGEGRFVADDDMMKNLIQNGQVATQYVMPEGIPSSDIAWNPNGSVCAVEGIDVYKRQILMIMLCMGVYVLFFLNAAGEWGRETVSYTHLDVYKRQPWLWERRPSWT